MKSEALKISRRLTWRLRHMMVERNIITAAELARRLEDIGFSIHPSQMTRVLKDRPIEIKTELMDALMEVLQCNIEDILKAEPVQVSEGGTAATGNNGAEKTKPARTTTVRKTKPTTLPPPAIPRVSLVPPQIKKTDPK